MNNSIEVNEKENASLSAENESANNEAIGEKAAEAIEYKYKFSIIMSVYKVEEFIDEAVQSLIKQSLNFKNNVQIIMVDDGSPDNSGAICDKYAEQYPDNIIVIHKENGGLSSARNEGLKYVEGRYVNFFDPDDILTRRTLEFVYKFFSAHDAETDIVAIPLNYFGDYKGPHHLNDKFKDGTRIINLEKDYQYIQLSLASAFVKFEYAKEMFFDDKLVIGEDAEQIMRILIKKPTLGVVSNCTYQYRRRGNSQVTAGSTKKGWYTDYVCLFAIKTLELAKAEFGYVPKFIQNAVMCDLQWRFAEPDEPKVLDADEIREYKTVLYRCLDYISDDIIMRQKHVVSDVKIAMLAKKYENIRFVTSTANDIYCGFDNAIVSKFSNNTLQLNFLDITKETVKISVRQIFFAAIGEIDEMYLTVNKEKISAENVKIVPNKTTVGDVASYYYMCDFTIPRDILVEKSHTVTFFARKEDCTVRNNNLRIGRFFPLEPKYLNSYYYQDGLMFAVYKNRLYIKRATAKDKKTQEKKLCKELWKSNKTGERKAVFARKMAAIYKAFHRKPLWIISDRLNKAGDNGEALFRYLKDSGFKDANYVYAITDCADYRKLKKLGNVVDRSSRKYKVLHLAADAIISSHADDFVINPFENYFNSYKDILATKPFIFLQHGITQNDISDWLNRYNKNIRGFIVAANPEADSLIDYDYYYDSDVVWKTGFARFDRLYNDEKKYITLMPTWRQYLMNGYDITSGKWRVGANFKESEYFKFYNSLINEERLIAEAEKHGYTVCFMPHPNLIVNIDVFDHNEKVKFYTINDEYKDVYAQSNLVLTDYSSALFDFAYLRKPVVYAQFDKEEFFGGKHICKSGYFDYERDGYGEVTYDYETTVNTLIEYIQNDCKIKPEYKARADKFFAFNDKNNCKRITERLMKLGK